MNISEFAKKQVEDIQKQVLSGVTEIKPYSMEKKNGCAFCPYHSICGFDEKIEGYEYRKLEKLSEANALNKMRGEVDTWE